MSPTDKKRLFLIDASGHVYRAYHALPKELATSKGLPTNAVLGFSNMLRKLLREEQPDYVVAAFDPPGPTIRHQAYEEYKKSRPATPPDLRVQLPYVRRVCEAFQVPILEIPGYEADDVIGSLARQAQEAGLETVIVSEDKDLLQLVGEGVTMLAERVDRRVYDTGAVVDKYGVPPESIPDFLALVGDTSDDIPGVKGIGQKGAMKILERYGTLEEAIEHADEITEMKYGEKLTAGADEARLSKQLATVHTDLPVELDLASLQRRDPDRRLGRELFMELEFSALLEDFVATADEEEIEYKTLEDLGDLDRALEAIADAGRVAIDILATGERRMQAAVVGLALSWTPGAGRYLPLGHTTLGAGNAASLEAALERLQPLLTGGDVEVVGHDLKAELVLLARHGVEGVSIASDAMIASYLVHPTRSGHDLEGLGLDFLGLKLRPLKDLLPAKQASLADVPIDAATRQAAERADVALRLADLFAPELEVQGLVELYRQLELPLIQVLADMERTGVRIDVDYLARMSRELGGDIDALCASIFEAAGGEFNLNSPQQLAEVLFDRLGLPAGGRTAKTGRRSTRAEVLERLAHDHAVVAEILEYRELAKLKSTYVDALPALVDPQTGRVHTSYNQAVAATGRLSSSDPNLQNIPIRRPLGRKIRKAFVPEEGHLLLTADYSQIELRIMAHLSGDPRLRAAFTEGGDVHRATAAEIFDIAPQEVSSEQRDRAKVINYGIMYGMGPQRLAREFGIGVKEARDFIDNYFDIYAEVKQFLEGTVERARREGYVTTLLGRIRHLPELMATNPAVRSFGERIAVNTPIQGTAADMIKRAMVRLHARLRDEGRQARMIMQVHDELVLELPEDEIDAVSEAVRQEMEGALELDVPVEVDIGSGPNWMEAKP